jgi:hypothetical protein
MSREVAVAGVLLVGLALGGVCAYVWSAILQAEAAEGARVARTPLGPRALTFLRLAQVRLRMAAQRKRAARIDRAIESGPRRLRFEETAELTLPPSAPVTNDAPTVRWSHRPSRMLSAVQLVLLILVVGGAVALATLGFAQVIAHLVASR